MALSAAKKRTTKQQNEMFGGVVIDYPVAASTTIYLGSFVKEGTAGIVVCDGTDAVPCWGVATETIDNSSGAAGAKNCRVLVGATLLVPASEVTGYSALADVGGKLYCVDDETLGNVVTDEDFGFIIGIEGTSFLCKHDPWAGL